MYLQKCVDSIIHQSYRNLEIILVDDGSTDNSSSICDMYAKQDRRIVVVHKKNGGLSSARNIGIAKAHGIYLSFIDSDDYIDHCMLEKLYSALVIHNAEIAICNYQNVYTEDYDGIHVENSEIKSETLSAIEAIDHLNKVAYIVTWNKLYKKSLFNNVAYTEDYIHEDEIIIHRLYGECKVITVIPDRLYFYVRRKGSIMSAGFNIRSIDYTKAWMDRVIYYHEQGWERQENLAIMTLWYLIHKDYFRFDNNTANKKWLKRTLKDFRKVLSYILRTDQISKKEKLTILIFAINPYMYKRLFF